VMEELFQFLAKLILGGKPACNGLGMFAAPHSDETILIPEFEQLTSM
jgi:hypothetical protein